MAHELLSLSTVHPQETRTEQTETRQAQDVQEVEMLQLTCKADLRLVDVLVDSITNFALICGLGEDEARAALRLVCQHCIEYGYENDAAQSLQCRLLRRADCLVIAIEDQGLPFHYQRLQHDAQLAALLAQTGAEPLRCHSLGRAGNRIEFVYPLAEHAVPVAEPSAPHVEVSATQGTGEELLPVRMMQADEALECTRAFYRSYGYSFESAFVYEPEQIATKLRDGTLRSCVVHSSWAGL